MRAAGRVGTAVERDSFGVSAAVCRTGRLGQRGGRTRGTRRVEEKKTAIVNGTIPKPSAVNPAIEPALEQIIFTALARDPNFRHQNALDLQDALLAYLYESGNRVNRHDLGNFQVRSTR